MVIDMNQRYHLSFLLTEDGINGIDLISFNKLIDLDNYVKENFLSTVDVRKKFDQDISEFCLDNREFIQDENKRNRRNWTGMIVVTFPEYKKNTETGQNELKFIRLPMLYKDGKQLKPKEECIDIIREKVKDCEIVKQIMNERWFLISENERHYLNGAYHFINGYQHDSFEEKQFYDFGYVFCRRLEVLSEDVAYYYLRCLGNICDLYEGRNKTQVNVTSVKSKRVGSLSKVVVVKRLTKKEKQELAKIEQEEEVVFSENAPDEFKYIFNKARETGDYDTLYNMYSIDEIDRYVIQGKRK